MFDENEFRSRLVAEWMAACRERDMFRFQLSVALSTMNGLNKKLETDKQKHEDKLREQKSDFDRMQSFQEQRHIKSVSALQSENRRLQHLLALAAGRSHVFKRVDEVAMGIRLANCLDRIGAVFLGDMAQLDEQQLLKSKNMGKKTIAELKAVLAEHGLQLGAKIANWAELRKANLSAETAQ